MNRIRRFLRRIFPARFPRNGFEYTVEDCIAAEEWLRRIGRFEQFDNNMTSRDGWSLIAFANSIGQSEMRRRCE